MHKRLWLVLSLVLSLFVLPDIAYARDVDVIGSFGSGMDVMFHPEDYKEQKEPVDNEESKAILAETPNQIRVLIRQFIRSGLTFKVDGGTFTPDVWWLAIARYFSFWRTTKAMLVGAVALVFVWWGVRKTIRMFFKAFRKGRI